ncbi:MAG: hypothetical protein Q4C96_10445 [Planctomycetia bacterium]|nr:hypothetical protein [Planctomycetia bacterium]
MMDVWRMEERGSRGISRCPQMAERGFAHQLKACDESTDGCIKEGSYHSVK